MKTSPDIVLPDGDCFRLLDFPPGGPGPARDHGTVTEGSPSHRNPLTYEGRDSESSPLLPQISSHSVALPILDHDSEGQFVTVHEFLQDRESRVCRKYGRRNRPATVKPDAHYRDHSEVCSPTPSSTPCRVQVESRNDRRGVSAYPRIQSKHITRRAPHHRRKKQFAKSLAQRLFEADVFSSGSSESSRLTFVRDPAHTSTRRPLQFVTSLNLTPSLESRMYPRRKGGARDGSRAPTQADSDSEILAVSNTARDASPHPNPIRPTAAATSGGRSSSRTWNSATAQRARLGTAGGSAAAALASGRRAQAFRARGGKQSVARGPPSPFGYVPLPLVWVKMRQGAV